MVPKQYLMWIGFVVTSGISTAKLWLPSAQPSLLSPYWKQHATVVKAPQYPESIVTVDGIGWHLLYIPSCQAKAQCPPKGDSQNIILNKVSFALPPVCAGVCLRGSFCFCACVFLLCIRDVVV